MGVTRLLDGARERIRFLTADSTQQSAADRVRPAILASWHRSRDLGVPADRVEVPYQRDPDLDTPFARSAAPIVDRLSEKLHGRAVSIIVTDAAGLVVRRRTNDADFERRLDRVLLAPGFSFAERFVGTNGIGTALAAGSATQVLGHEHYAEHLEDFACAAVPVHDPISGRVAGVMDLTCRRVDADALLMTLAATTADQIETALLADASAREVALLQAYRHACRHGSGAVFAVSPDAVTVNDRLRTEIPPEDQRALLAYATEIGESLRAGRQRSVRVALPSGATARLTCQQVDAGGALPTGVVAGIVAQVRVVRDVGAATVVAREAGRVPGLVGDSPLWRQVVADALASARSGEWIAVEGEPGVGKCTLLRAAYESLGRRVRVVDASDDLGVVPRALDHGDAVVLTHVDTLTAPAANELTGALQGPRAAGTLAMTLGDPAAGDSPDAVERLLGQVARLHTVPPLRLRIDDLVALVPALLAGTQATCSPEAMRVLLRCPWPGNVAQLRQVLRSAARHRRSGPIESGDLPPEVHATSRHVLSAIESLERDAIVRGLAAAGGDKVAAARALGISRATIYRRMREFGIVSPT